MAAAASTAAGATDFTDELIATAVSLLEAAPNVVLVSAAGIRARARRLSRNLAAPPRPASAPGLDGPVHGRDRCPAFSGGGRVGSLRRPCCGVGPAGILEQNMGHRLTRHLWCHHARLSLAKAEPRRRPSRPRARASSLPTSPPARLASALRPSASRTPRRTAGATASFCLRLRVSTPFVEASALRAGHFPVLVFDRPGPQRARVGPERLMNVDSRLGAGSAVAEGFATRPPRLSTSFCAPQT